MDDLSDYLDALDPTTRRAFAPDYRPMGALPGVSPIGFRPLPLTVRPMLTVPVATGGGRTPGCDVLCANGEYVCDPVSCSTRGGFPPAAGAGGRFSPGAFRPGGGSPPADPGSPPGAPPAPTCPTGASFDPAQNVCVCAAGTAPNADGSACVPVQGVTEDGSMKWLLFAAGAAFIAWRWMR
jgi:hypothetical protein